MQADIADVKIIDGEPSIETLPTVNLIFGINGQDGAHLAELLTEEGEIVIGVYRRSSTKNHWRLAKVQNNPNLSPLLQLVEGDVTDPVSINGIVKYAQGLCDEGETLHIYCLAAQSVVEDTLLPLKTHKGIEHRTFGDLWKWRVGCGDDVRIEEYGNTDIEVIDVDEKLGRQLKALGYWNGAGTWFPIKQISRHKWNGKVCRVTQKFGQVTVTPNHSLLDSNQQECKPSDNRWLLNMRKMNFVNKKPIHKVQLSNRNHSHMNNEWFWCDEVGNEGKVKRFVENESLHAFCRFVGAFVSEGWTVYNKKNDTYHVCVCQNDKAWLESLEKDVRQFFDGNICYVESKKERYDSTWRLELKSKALYQLMRNLCGENSGTKCLPIWYTSLDDQYLKSMWQTLYEGDGSCVKYSYDSWRYGTTSYKLACQLSLMFTMLGYDYTMHYNDYKDKEEWAPVWNFRQCKTYTTSRGMDGKKVEYLDYDGYVYDITVDEVSNFTVGVGNIVVHNSHVGTSFKQPDYTMKVNALGPLYILEAMREYAPNAHFYQASTSEMFGKNFSTGACCEPEEGLAAQAVNIDGAVRDEQPLKFQDENTPLDARSPYAVAKIAAHNTVKLYRDAYKLHASCGILFNHESSYRGEEFVTRKVTLYVAALLKTFGVRGTKAVKEKDGEVRIHQVWKLPPIEAETETTITMDGIEVEKLHLGNLEAFRDWGYAKDYVKAMRTMLYQNEPDDYVIATGKTYSIRDMLDAAFGPYVDNWEKFVYQDPEFYRPAEVDYLCGDASKAKEKLGWEPKTSMEEMIRMMVETDLERMNG